jgi:hypothetical protein
MLAGFIVATLEPFGIESGGGWDRVKHNNRE